VMSLFASINLGWSDDMGEMLYVFGLSTFNTDVMAPDCAAEMRPGARLLSRFMIPVYGAFVLAAMYFIVRWLRRHNRIRSDRLSDVNRFIGAAIFMYHMLFQLMVQSVLEAFACT